MKIFIYLSLVLVLNFPSFAFSDSVSPSVKVRKVISASRFCRIKYRKSIVRQERCKRKVDPDKDNIRSRFDNCKSTKNPSQVDSNDNSVGDACEVADLAVLSTDNNGNVAVFRDVKNKQKPYGIADVVLTNVFSCPRSLVMTDGGRLFVGDECNHRVYVYNDIMTITDGQEPDFYLDYTNRHPSACNIYYPRKMQIHKGDLYIFDDNSNCINIFRDAENIQQDSIVDAVVYPNGIDMIDFTVDTVNDQLLFSKYSNNWRSSSVNEGIDDLLVYKNISSLEGVKNDSDLKLNFGGANYIYAFNNHLYGVQSERSFVAILKDASKIVDGQKPDSYLIGYESGLYYPHSVVEVGSTLFINNRYRRSGGISAMSRASRDFEDTIGYLNDTLAGFKDLTSIQSFQSPDIELSPIFYGREMIEILGSLFIIDEETDYVGAILDGYSVRKRTKLDTKLTTFSANFRNPYAMTGRVR